MDFVKLDRKAEFCRNHKNVLSKNELEYLKKMFVIKYIQESEALEGHQISYADINLIFNDTDYNSESKDFYEIKNQRDAFAVLWSGLRKQLELNENTIYIIHKMLMKNIVPSGIYRRNDIHMHGLDIEFPEPGEIPFLMRKFLEELQTKIFVCNMPESGITPISLACWVHAKIFSMQPFWAGNGKLARFLLNYQLMRCGFLPVSIHWNMKNRYYNAVRGYYQTEDLEPLVTLIAELEAHSLNVLVHLEKKRIEEKKKSILILLNH